MSKIEIIDLTVNILSFNRPTFLKEALFSVLSQTRLPKKIIIYDNGSLPIVFKTVEPYLSEITEWVGSEKNKPVLWNFKRALENTNTEFVMFLHDDDRLCPEFLNEQIKIMNENLDFVALSSNGFLIDQDGQRNGKYVMPSSLESNIEQYRNSGDVALKYAGSSCVPFSPAIYRSQILKDVKFRDDFGKVVDAVLFCDLAEHGVVACQTMPLYECRMHSGQDSSSFEYSLMIKLDKFFIKRKYSTISIEKKVIKLLSGNRSIRKIKLVFRSIINGNYYGVRVLKDENGIDLVNVCYVFARFILRKIKLQ
jgi:GT2 family glycosyltransferase